MLCHQARQLFDAYLDGELSPSLATELGAHRLSCPDCRQALALLEVSGHILRSDRDPVQAPEDFTDRLLACVDTAPLWRKRVFSALYIGGPLAAAAVIALAFVGAFDRNGPSQVAGVQQIAPAPMVQTAPPPKPTAAATVEAMDPAEKALTDFFDKTQQRMTDQGQSVQKVFDLTILQVLDILEEARERSKDQARPPWNAPDAAAPNLESAEPADADEYPIEEAYEELEPQDSEPPSDPQDES